LVLRNRSGEWTDYRVNAPNVRRRRQNVRVGWRFGRRLVITLDDRKRRRGRFQLTRPVRIVRKIRIVSAEKCTL
jgi:hypothetical protein